MSCAVGLVAVSSFLFKYGHSTAHEFSVRLLLSSSMSGYLTTHLPTEIIARHQRLLPPLQHHVQTPHHDAIGLGRLHRFVPRRCGLDGRSRCCALPGFCCRFVVHGTLCAVGAPSAGVARSRLMGNTLLIFSMSFFRRVFSVV